MKQVLIYKLISVISVISLAYAVPNTFDSLHIINEQPTFSNRSTNKPVAEGHSLDENYINSKSPKIHSWIAMDIQSTQILGGNQYKTRPRSVASTIKLAIVNAILDEVAQNRISLDEILTIKGPNDQSYDGEKIGKTYTVRNAIFQTLYRSSNTCPNLLAIRLGNLTGTNHKLKKLGYHHTTYNYLSAVNRTESANAGSTAYDMALVAKDFYQKYRLVQGNETDGAWYAFSHAKDMIKARGHKTLGGKIGSNSLCATNTGLFEIKDKIIAIVVFSEENGLINNYYADKYLNDASTLIANQIYSPNSNTDTTKMAQVEVSSGCLNLRLRPQGKILKCLKNETLIEVIHTTANWAYVNHESTYGYMHIDYIKYIEKGASK
jgi:hypothetical protein